VTLSRVNSYSCVCRSEAVRGDKGRVLQSTDCPDPLTLGPSPRSQFFGRGGIGGLHKACINRNRREVPM
jgi:hypothetical protein